MRRACLLFLALPLVVLSLVGCATTAPAGGAGADQDAPSADADSSKKTERKRDALERKLEVAQARLAVEQLEAAAYEEQQEVKLRHATAEVEMARARLARFQEADKPNKLASAQLDLESAQDRAQEAVDELKQIEIMYADQDLDDMTAEFVVSRGRRAAERAARRLEIQSAQLQALEERELPEEESKLSLALDKATDALREVETSAESGRQKKAISVKEAENAIAGILDELAELSEKAKP